MISYRFLFLLGFLIPTFVQSMEENLRAWTKIVQKWKCKQYDAEKGNIIKTEVECRIAALYTTSSSLSAKDSPYKGPNTKIDVAVATFNELKEGRDKPFFVELVPHYNTILIPIGEQLKEGNYCRAKEMSRIVAQSLGIINCLEG